MTGPGDVSLIAAATTANSGDKTTSSVPATTRSKIRLPARAAAPTWAGATSRRGIPCNSSITERQLTSSYSRGTTHTDTPLPKPRSDSSVWCTGLREKATTTASTPSRAQSSGKSAWLPSTADASRGSSSTTPRTDTSGQRCNRAATLAATRPVPRIKTRRTRRCGVTSASTRTRAAGIAARPSTATSPACSTPGPPASSGTAARPASQASTTPSGRPYRTPGRPSRRETINPSAYRPYEPDAASAARKATTITATTARLPATVSPEYVRTTTVETAPATASATTRHIHRGTPRLNPRSRCAGTTTAAGFTAWGGASAGSNPITRCVMEMLSAQTRFPRYRPRPAVGNPREIRRVPPQ